MTNDKCAPDEVFDEKINRCVKKEPIKTFYKITLKTSDGGHIGPVEDFKTLPEAIAAAERWRGYARQQNSTSYGRVGFTVVQATIGKISEGVVYEPREEFKRETVKIIDFD